MIVFSINVLADNLSQLRVKFNELSVIIILLALIPTS